MDNRQEFVRLAMVEGTNVAALCRRFGVSRKTAYKWLGRAERRESLGDRSRRPLKSPKRTEETAETAILAVRAEHPTWGGRKIRKRLIDLGTAAPPAASTISGILRRHGLTDPDEARHHKPFERFEHAGPNDLWQMDFKGHFAFGGGRCHPLTVLDDHSRYSICLAACEDQSTMTVRDALTARFRLYGLPDRINVDNGNPWGTGPDHRFTVLTVWLLQLGIKVSHSRAYHPQTNGKAERFHRTFKADVLQSRWFADLAKCQDAFDAWRIVYNTERPHQAIGMAVPSSRYRVSSRAFPETLPEPQYHPDDIIRKVQQGGEISLDGHTIDLPAAFVGQHVGLRATAIDGRFDVFFTRHLIAQVDLRDQMTKP